MLGLGGTRRLVQEQKQKVRDEVSGHAGPAPAGTRTVFKYAGFKCKILKQGEKGQETVRANSNSTHNKIDSRGNMDTYRPPTSSNGTATQSQSSGILRMIPRIVARSRVGVILSGGGSGVVVVVAASNASYPKPPYSGIPISVVPCPPGGRTRRPHRTR